MTNNIYSVSLPLINKPR